MRIFMLRMLLAWWMIPTSWAILYPLFWLTGPKSAFRDVIEFNKVLWNGFDE